MSEFIVCVIEDLNEDMSWVLESDIELEVSKNSNAIFDSAQNKCNKRGFLCLCFVLFY